MSIPYAEVIGDPIAHSKSPLIHGFWLKALGIDADYRKTLVHGPDLAAWIAERRADPEWRGCNVTIPHKLAVMPLVDRLTGEAAAIGAVNTIARDAAGTLVGINSDYAGVIDALAGIDPARPVCLIGAGGAARAAVEALRILGIAELRLIARDEVAGRRLLDGFGVEGCVLGFDEAERALAGCGAVINSTPLGMTSKEPMPEVVLAALSSALLTAIVFDMVYVPLETPLLARAAALGRRPVDGLTMLIGQAAIAFGHFFGQAPPRDRDDRLREYLTA